MSKKVYLFSLVLLSLIFASCSETEEVGKYDNWRTRNEAFIDSLATVYETKADHGNLKRFEVLRAPGEYIYYKVLSPIVTDALAKDKVGERPKSANSSVSIYYKGTNILGEWFDGFTGENPVAGNPSPSAGGDTPVSTFDLSNLITGWQEVLLQMTIGERWLAYIPWKYAYGSEGSSSGSILGYSALIFDIQLLDADPSIKD